MSAVLSVLLVAAGAALLAVAADAFADHVQMAAARLGVSMVSVAVLLAGAEPEEALTAMVAAGRGHPALATGDAVGANLVVALALGVAALLTPLPVGREARQYAVAASALGVLAWLLLRNGVLDRVEGLLLLLVFAALAAVVWRRDRRPPAVGELAGHRDRRPADRPEGGAGDDRATSRALAIVLVGLVGMVAGGALAVLGTNGLVGVLGLRESVLGLTVLAMATSAEMLALVWAAHRHGVGELVVAGAIGALAYNATVTLGLAALVSPLAIGRHNVIVTTALVVALVPLLLLAGSRSGFLPRPVGVVLVGGYVLVTGWLLAH